MATVPNESTEQRTAPAHVLEHPTRALAEGLAQPLVEACGGRLDTITWFHTDWQRGGAATGRSRWTDDHGNQVRVVVKLPVNNRELLWMRRLQPTPGDTTPPVVPRLVAGDETIGGYDLAWIVIEHLPHGPLGGHWHDGHVPRIAEAAARFAMAAAAYPVDREPRHEEWSRLVSHAREAIKVNVPAERQRWSAALKSVTLRLDALVAEWEARTPIEWLHGDLHLANAMWRDGPDARDAPGTDDGFGRTGAGGSTGAQHPREPLHHGPVCLIDLAEVHPGHWTEDAVYLERQLWARPERLAPCKPVRAIADARGAVGLDNGHDFMRLAALRRLLLAATAPAFLKSEGSPTYLGACLERLEQGLGQVK